MYKDIRVKRIYGGTNEIVNLLIARSLVTRAMRPRVGQLKREKRVQKVLVIGAGVAGLASALALSAKGFQVTLVEADEPPPSSLSPADSWDWKRRGAPQVRQPHFFMGRLRNLLRRDYPALIERMLAAGIWELPFADTLHPLAKAGYKPEPGDLDATPLCARRTTFEMVLRRFIETEGVATIRSGCRVQELLFERRDDGVHALGCKVLAGAEPETLSADVVVDASGRGSGLVAQLKAAGVSVSEEHHASEMVYNTRHFRLRAGKTFPPMNGYPGAEFADFFIGALPADNGAFTVTLGCWKDDPILAPAARNTEVFASICAMIDKVRPWVDPTRSEPLSDVFSWANMDFLWRSLVQPEGPSVLNYFLVGDAAVRSNPKFGRGCTWGAVAAHHLADVLGVEGDPKRRAIQYDQALRDDFRSDWEAMLNVDRMSRRKFETDIGLRRKTIAQHFATRIESHILNVAMLADARVQRAIMRGYHGLDSPTGWTRKPEVWLAILNAAAPFSPAKTLARAAKNRPSRAEIEGFALRSSGGGA